MSEIRRLDALTSLRFFAAAAIVLYHLRDFGLLPTVLDGWYLGQTVSFFFVLSGFILAYVHPDLGGRRAAADFLVARVARIWPAHIAAFVLLLLTVKQPWGVADVHYRELFANLSLVHAWVPIPQFFFSFNAPSWSISTEFFFYLCFPLLVLNWQRTWWWKLTGAFGLAVAVILIAEVFDLPPYPDSGRDISSTALVYINPLGRLAEFVLGIAIGKFFLGLPGRRESRTALFTALEILAVAGVLGMLRYSGELGAVLRPFIGRVGEEWLLHSGIPPLSAALVLVMAMERGWVSALLSRPLLVLLGEISYSVYLTHQVLLRALIQHGALFDSWPLWVRITLYVLVTLGLSWLIWRFIERPARRGLVGLWRRRSNLPAWTMFSPPFLRPVGGYLWGAALVMPVVFSTTLIMTAGDKGPQCVLPGEDRHYADVADARFGDKLKLHDLHLTAGIDKVVLNLTWESLPGHVEPYFDAVHLLTAKGEMRAQADTPQQRVPDRRNQADNPIWKESIAISRRSFRGITTLGLGVYDRNVKLLEIDRGQRDQDGTRLLLPVCADGST